MFIGISGYILIPLGLIHLFLLQYLNTPSLYLKMMLIYHLSYQFSIMYGISFIMIYKTISYDDHMQ